MATLRERWALALAAVATELTAGHHSELGGWGPGDHSAEWCRSTLATVWGVTDAASFQSVITWLWNTGHRTECMEVLAGLPQDPRKDDPKQQLVRMNQKLLQGRGLLAWDIGRFVAVVGWGRWAGYVSEPEAWRCIHGAATWMQPTFKSWREFGRHYEFGRYYCTNEDDPERDAILERLTSHPDSPWMQLDWGAPLTGPDGGGKRRIKRTRCWACGARKQLASRTGWVYCDACGALADWDFRQACVAGSALPGPAYAAAAAHLEPQLDAARSAGDVDQCLALQRDLYGAWVAASPGSVPPRTAEPGYRAAYVAYLAQAAVCTDLDPEWNALALAVHEATARIPAPGAALPGVGRPRVPGDLFWPLHAAVRAQLRRGALLAHAAGVSALHPDGVPADLAERFAWSAFVQAWVPLLDDADADRLLLETGLSGEYGDLPDVSVVVGQCGVCGGRMEVVPRASRVVCEACGCVVDVGG